MATRYGRLREKISLSSSFSNLTVGVLKKYKKSDNKIVSTTPVIVVVPVDSGTIKRTWDNINPGPPFSTGGPFASIEVNLPSSEVRDVGVNRTASSFFDPTYWYEYTGGMTNPDRGGIPYSASKYKELSPFSTDTGLVPNMAAYCAEVFSKLRPTIAKAGLAVALAEARDIPQMLKTSAHGFHDAWKSMGGNMSGNIMKPKKLADHFINHQFGWKPFIKDLTQFYTVYDQSKVYVDEVRRNNNTWVKRVRTIDHNESSQVIIRNYTPYGVEPAGLNPSGVLPGGLGIADAFMKNKNVNGNSCRGYSTLEEVVTTKVWASGSFKFYRQEFDSSLEGFNSKWDQIRRMLALYGAEINPSVVWKATPWTWLIDWFTNVGGIIDNFTSMMEDSMVARYMYLMHHHVREYRFTQVHHYHAGDRSMVWSQFSDVKRREEAPSPYNFCFGWQNLTAKQLAILAALGISRKRS